MRLSIAAVSLSVLGLSYLLAQNPQSSTGSASISPQLKSELVALRDAALSDNYTYQQTAHLADNIGPRPVGSPQAEAAVEYVANELRHLGLEVQLEKVQVPHWIRGVETAELVEYPGHVPETSQKIVLTALGGNAPTSASGVTADVVVASSFED